MSMDAIVASDQLHDRFALRTPLVVAILVGAAAALHLSWTLPSDTSWLLTVCDRMLAGQKLYTDITELNPPMSAWLYLPWVWLAAKSGVSPEVVTVCAVIAICMAMIALSGHILTTARLLRDTRRWWLVATLALVVAPIMTFSQREHFAVAFALPMLAAIAGRAARRPMPFWAAILAGVCGGLTMAVKPHFAFAIVCPLLCAAIVRRSILPLVAVECLVAGATFIVYLGLIVAVYPEYFEVMLPLVTTIYLPNSNPLFAVLTQPYVIATYVCLIAWVQNANSRNEVLSQVLLAAVVGFFIAYLLPGRGWIYHILPVVTLAMIGLGLSLFTRAGCSGQVGGSGLRFPVGGAVAICVALVVTCDAAIERLRFDVPFVRDLAQVLRPLGPDLKIALIADDLQIASPVHRLVGATLVNRGPSLWMTANAMRRCRRNPSPELAPACEEAKAKERAMLAEDLKRNPPDVLLTNTIGFDWLQWASEDASVAEIIARFRPYATVEHGALRAQILLPYRDADLKLRPSIQADR